jgi:preprotein translocase subunit SecD
VLDFPKWKTWSMWLTVLVCLVLALPNALSPSQLAAIPDGLPKSQLPLGLDLRGGSHLMLEATPQDVEKAKLEALEDTVRAELRAADGGAIGSSDLSL